MTAPLLGQLHLSVGSNSIDLLFPMYLSNMYSLGVARPGFYSRHTLGLGEDVNEEWIVIYDLISSMHSLPFSEYNHFPRHTCSLETFEQMGLSPIYIGYLLVHNKLCPNLEV